MAIDPGDRRGVLSVRRPAVNKLSDRADALVDYGSAGPTPSHPFALDASARGAG